MLSPASGGRSLGGIVGMQQAMNSVPKPGGDRLVDKLFGQDYVKQDSP